MSQPSLFGQLEAMGREMFNDIRSKLNEVFLGQPDRPPEIGTPMAPTQKMINADLEAYDQQVSRAAALGQGTEQDRGIER